MKLSDRVKKEASEGLVRAILEHAGYRVVEFGIEKIIRELTCMNSKSYKEMNFPDAIRLLPDFTIMSPDQKEQFLVEVKYRNIFDEEIFDDEKIINQVKTFGKIYLVIVVGSAPDPKNLNHPERCVRCVKLSFVNGEIVRDLKDGNRNYTWYRMRELHELFNRIAKKERHAREAVMTFRNMLAS